LGVVRCALRPRDESTLPATYFDLRAAHRGRDGAHATAARQRTWVAPHPAPLRAGVSDLGIASAAHLPELQRYSGFAVPRAIGRHRGERFRFVLGDEPSATRERATGGPAPLPAARR